MPTSVFGDVRLVPYFYVGATLRLALVTQTTELREALGIVVLLPLQYLWWRLIGYFG